MTTEPWASSDRPLTDFFKLEIRNKQEAGTTPATLYSAADSLVQAPIDVIESWFGVGPESRVELIFELVEFAWLLANHRSDTKLAGLVGQPNDDREDDPWLASFCRARPWVAVFEGEVIARYSTQEDAVAIVAENYPGYAITIEHQPETERKVER
jgi:hypothetical protein